MSRTFKQRLPLIVVLLMIFTLFFTVFGERGLIKIYKLKTKLQQIKTKKAFLEKDNIRLTDHVRKMKKERVFQERKARETLGLVYEDEIIYDFSK
jgi:cell division protein FtsB